MAVFYVVQNVTFNEESSGGYVWSPQKTANGASIPGYRTMLEIQKGDTILHHFGGEIVAIGIAKTDCYESPKPSDLNSGASTNWNSENGYKVDIHYIGVNPIRIREHSDWIKNNHIPAGAFNRNGVVSQGKYMSLLQDTYAIYLLKVLRKQQTAINIIDVIDATLTSILAEKEYEYNNIEREIINDLTDSAWITGSPQWEGIRRSQETIISPSTGREVPKRDTKRAADALIKANFLCEFESTDRTFLRKNGNPYTEPHHLIPISKYREFQYSLDVLENITSLCSHCHNLIHYGRYEDKETILQKLYEERKTALETCGLKITIEQLLSYYQ